MSDTDKQTLIDLYEILIIKNLRGFSNLIDVRIKSIQIQVQRGFNLSLALDGFSLRKTSYFCVNLKIKRASRRCGKTISSFQTIFFFFENCASNKEFILNSFFCAEQLLENEEKRFW